MQAIILYIISTEVARFSQKGLEGSRGNRNEAALKISFFPINVDNSECRHCRQLLFEMTLRKVGVVQFSFLSWGLPGKDLDFLRVGGTLRYRAVF